MKIMTVISPDKLSMTMFCDFYKSTYIGDDIYKILDMNCLNSLEIQELRISDFIKNNKDLRNAIIKYKTKPQTVLQNLPKALEENSSYVVKFDIFSTHPELIKDFDGSGLEIINRWTANMSARGI